jgi:hypothetical protein
MLGSVWGGKGKTKLDLGLLQPRLRELNTYLGIGIGLVP